MNTEEKADAVRRLLNQQVVLEDMRAALLRGEYCVMEPSGGTSFDIVDETELLRMQQEFLDFTKQQP